MRARLLFLILACCVLTSCATANVARYPNANYGPTNPQNVSVYSNFPPVMYDVIGEVEGSGDSYSDWGMVSGEMRKKAAEIGGDAVVILVQDRPYIGSVSTPGSVQGTTQGYAYGAPFYQANSTYTYTPPTSTPMYGISARGVVIKYRR